MENMNKYILGAGILALLLILALFGFSNTDTKTNTQDYNLVNEKVLYTINKEKSIN